MFVATTDVERSSLLQGDILTGIQLLGALNYNEISHSMPATGKGSPVAWAVSKPPAVGDAMVLSHSCEVAQENGVKLTSIILAPLRDVSSATPKDKMKELIDSNLIDQSGAAASYLKYFYLEPSHLLSYQHGAVADFSKCFSIRKNSYDFLLAAKVLQLQEPTRNSMALKLALYFHRSQQPSAA